MRALLDGYVRFLAEAGAAGNSQKSCTSLSAANAKSIKFDYAVSSELYYDHLKFYIDGDGQYPAEEIRKIDDSPDNYFVIVTRGHQKDAEALRAVIGRTAGYVGMIGSKRKVLSIYKALEKEGISGEKFERVHAPVGLEIGALTPEEIAISITAELIGVRRNAVNLQHKSVKLAASTTPTTG